MTPLLDIYLENRKRFIPKDIYTQIYVHYSWWPRHGKQLKCPLTHDWLKKVWYIRAVEYHSAIRKDVTLPLMITWMNCENTMQSEIKKSITIFHLNVGYKTESNT